MFEYEATEVYRPESAELAFLPEGPMAFGSQEISWVAIQHGADSMEGSINILNLASGTNRQHALLGRPGFAFPTSDPDVFLTGAELRVGFYNVAAEDWVEGSVEIEGAADGTIINDGVPCGDGVIFGTKDLEFKEPKGGLFLWKPGMSSPKLLRGGQTCSNGKEVLTVGDDQFLLDIDTPTKVVVKYPLDLEAGLLGEPETVADLRDVDAFPDGMILTPDQKSVIIAMYNPNNVPDGEARMHRLSDGELEGIWKVPGSPRVTCPQLVSVDGAPKLVLTTAVEHMSAEEQASHSKAGSIFMGETPFASAPAANPIRF